MRVTIKDVAKKANVSVATVSLVIHDHQRISPETKRRVLKAIKDLDYYPSRSARGLVSRQTKNIGFIITEDHFLRTEPFYTKIFLGTEFEARLSEYYILLTTIPTDYKPTDPLPRFVLEGNVDGVIIAGKIPDSIINRLKQFKLPIIFVDYYPPEGDFSAVLIDNVTGGLQATEHLISCGHKKIGFIGGDIDHPSIRDRFQGYKTALEKNKIIYNPSYAVTNELGTNRECGYNAAKKLLSQNNDITSIFICNDAMALGAMQYLKSQNKIIPDDISIIGFDDVEAGLISEPNLTTMRVPKIELGAKTMNLMAQYLENKVTDPYKLLMPVELVLRKSTCPGKNN
ncbi:MAG: LacI family DNA-binding transcriptional regulator [Calditrichaceae bacterium]